jgi:hypothetical protein
MEVAIAIVIAGVVALIARRLFETAVTTASALEREANGQEATWESWIALRELAWQAWTPGPDSVALAGDARHTSFLSRCLSGGGWQEPCRATITLADSAGWCRMSIATSMRKRMVSEPVARCRLLYLVDPANGGLWAPVWTLKNTLPLALGIVQGPDTAIVRLGPPT